MFQRTRRGDPAQPFRRLRLVDIPDKITELTAMVANSREGELGQMAEIQLKRREVWATIGETLETFVSDRRIFVNGEIFQTA